MCVRGWMEYWLSMLEDRDRKAEDYREILAFLEGNVSLGKNQKKRDKIIILRKIQHKYLCQWQY